MEIAPGRHRCVTCGKEKATLRCGGCLQEFCFNHSTDHRQELSKQLDIVEVGRDLFRQTLTDQTIDPNKHVLMEQINDWERESIKKIQQTAQETKEILFKHTTEHIKRIEINLNKLTERLRQSREENDFYETDLRQWNAELTQLSNELVKLPNINLRKNSTSLINTISVDITSEPPSPLESKYGFGNPSAGFSTGRNNNENNNPIGDEGFNWRRGDQNGRARSNGENIGFASNYSANLYTCYNCGKVGHISRRCPERRIPNCASYGGFSLDVWRSQDD